MIKTVHTPHEYGVYVDQIITVSNDAHIDTSGKVPVVLHCHYKKAQDVCDEAKRNSDEEPIKLQLKCNLQKRSMSQKNGIVLVQKCSISLDQLKPGRKDFIQRPN